VAWLVSNCHESNNRQKYVHELKKYIPVDIYGGCGTMKCPISNKTECFEMLDRDYKFYLAFENANCKDYITEKLLVNSLG
jgi:glycoprotein 3-alpha-L-fucosyltransferase